MDVLKTDEYESWFRGLRDQRAQARINARILRLSLGNPGDVAPVGEGVSEMRIFYGPGYRIYFVTLGAAAVILCGGDKSTQTADIKRALALAEQARS